MRKKTGSLRQSSRQLNLATLLSAFLVLGPFFGAWAQKTLASPRDSVNGTVSGAHIKVNYGSPSVKGRQIWGKLVPYGQVWRAGANEATTFQTDKPLKVRDKVIEPGKYSFFAIPTRESWTLIFNKVPNQWGAFEYDPSMDAARVEVEPQQADSLYERLRYDLKDNKLLLKWEKLTVPVELQPAN